MRFSYETLASWGHQHLERKDDETHIVEQEPLLLTGRIRLFANDPGGESRERRGGGRRAMVKERG